MEELLWDGEKKNPPWVLAAQAIMCACLHPENPKVKATQTPIKRENKPSFFISSFLFKFLSRLNVVLLLLMTVASQSLFPLVLGHLPAALLSQIWHTSLP